MKKARIFIFLLGIVLLSGCNYGQVGFKLVDKQTKQPIASTSVHLREIWDCSTSDKCNPPYVFQGQTDKQGMFYVKIKNFSKIDLNLLTDGYYSKLITTTSQVVNNKTTRQIIIDNNGYELAGQINIELDKVTP